MYISVLFESRQRVDVQQVQALALKRARLCLGLSCSACLMMVMLSGGREKCRRCQSSEPSGLPRQCPVEDLGTETCIPLPRWPGLSKKSAFDSSSVSLLFIPPILSLVFGSLTGFSWPAEAMGSCWSCLYRDPIRDNHLTKFKVTHQTSISNC